MKLIRKIKKHEMLRRWAIAEVYVEYLEAIHLDEPQEILRLLHSNHPEQEKRGIDRSLKPHHLSLVDCMGADISWFLTALEIKQSEFNKLYTLPVLDLARISNDTYRVSEAASIIQQKPLLDPRITAIKNTLKSNYEQVQLSGITVVAENFDGPYTIIEGNGRLISLYSILFLEENSYIQNKQIEIVLGLSDAKFEILHDFQD